MEWFATNLSDEELNEVINVVTKRRQENIFWNRNVAL
jgi:hypothetical protein